MFVFSEIKKKFRENATRLKCSDNALIKVAVNGRYVYMYMKYLISFSALFKIPYFRRSVPGAL